MTALPPDYPGFPGRALRPVLPGLFLAVLTLLFGFSLGVVFGLDEDAIKSRLTASAAGGSLGYSLFWLLAGFRAPGLGGTGAAKESLSWLAIPSSGLVVVATGAVAALLGHALLSRRNVR